MCLLESMLVEQRCMTIALMGSLIALRIRFHAENLNANETAETISARILAEIR